MVAAQSCHIASMSDGPPCEEVVGERDEGWRRHSFNLLQLRQIGWSSSPLVCLMQAAALECWSYT